MRYSFFLFLHVSTLHLNCANGSRISFVFPTPLGTTCQNRPRLLLLEVRKRSFLRNQKPSSLTVRDRRYYLTTGTGLLTIPMLTLVLLVYGQRPAKQVTWRDTEDNGNWQGWQDTEDNGNWQAWQDTNGKRSYLTTCT